MEIRGQARSSGIGMPQSMGYNTPPQHNQESPAKLPSNPRGSTPPEQREHGGLSSDISPNQTLDRQNLTHQHHHHHHQLNLHLYRDPDQDQDHHQEEEEQQQQRVRDGSPDADLATTPVAGAAVASPSNSKTVPSSQPRTQTTAAESTSNSTSSVRYRECLKNHAAIMGGHVLDGCGEFMPSGEEGTPEALKCAACDCHRNFHRKEIHGEQQTGTSYFSTYHPSRTNYTSHRTTRHQSHPSASTVPPHPHKYGNSYTHVFGTSPSTGPNPMMMAFGGNNGAPAESSSEDLNMFQSDTGQQGVLQSSYSMSKKRFRTKFTHQQKDKMHEFAQKLGWRIQKQDEQELHQFCEEVGVKRQVFKVWMHNNKQAMKKKEM